MHGGKLIVVVGLASVVGCGGAIAADDDAGSLASIDGSVPAPPTATATSTSTSTAPRDAGPPPPPSPIDDRCAPAARYTRDYVTPRAAVGAASAPTGGAIPMGRWALVSETRWYATGPVAQTKASLGDKKTVVVVGTAKLRVDSRYRRVTGGFVVEEVDEWAVGGYSAAGVSLAHNVSCSSGADVKPFAGLYSVSGDTLVVQPSCDACGYQTELTFRRE